MKLAISGLIALLLISCNTSETKYDGSSNSKEEANKVSESSLDGTWTDGTGPNASFSIEKDSIFDVEHFSAAKFERMKDSVIFYYPDLTVKVKAYKTHEDTLIFESGETRTVYWRFKD